MYIVLVGTQPTICLVYYFTLYIRYSPLLIKIESTETLAISIYCTLKNCRKTSFHYKNKKLKMDDRGDSDSECGILNVGEVAGTSSKQSTNRRLQKYRKELENNPKLKFWINKDAGNIHNAKCSVCNTIIIAEKSSLLRHANSRKHLNNCNSMSVKQKNSMERFLQAKG